MGGLDIRDKLRRKLKAQKIEPMSIPDGICFLDGGPCVDRFEYRNCSVCSCEKDISRIRKKRNETEDVDMFEGVNR